MGNEQTFSAIDRFQSMLRARFQQAMDRYLAAVIKEAQSRHPYKDRSGALTRSIRRGALGWKGHELRGEVTAGAHYAEYVEKGTKPHRLEARKAKALHFFYKGKEIFVKRLKEGHPGSKPYPFLGPAILRTEGEFRRLFSAAWKEARRAAGLV